MTSDATMNELLSIRLAPVLKRQDDLEKRIEALERKMAEKKEPPSKTTT